MGDWAKRRLSGPEPFESIRGEIDHTEDALIAATAQYETAVLATEDQRLIAKARAHAVTVIGRQEFYGRLAVLARAR
jgi:rRNA-processing protein FCF1